jgi:hypothetical protein
MISACGRSAGSGEGPSVYRVRGARLPGGRASPPDPRGRPRPAAAGGEDHPPPQRSRPAHQSPLRSTPVPSSARTPAPRGLFGQTKQLVLVKRSNTQLREELVGTLSCHLKVERVGAEVDFFAPDDGAALLDPRSFERPGLIPERKHPTTGQVRKIRDAACSVAEPNAKPVIRQPGVHYVNDTARCA